MVPVVLALGFGVGPYLIGVFTIGERTLPPGRTGLRRASGGDTPRTLAKSSKRATDTVWKELLNFSSFSVKT